MPPFNERPQVQAFVEAYKKKTGYLPDIYATHYYDATGMLIAVMKKYGIDREKIREGFPRWPTKGSSALTRPMRRETCGITLW